MPHASRLSPLVLLALLLALIPAAQPALAATFTVTNTNATGAGSLYQAIQDANNSAGADTINFDIPAGQANAAGVWTINITTLLPPLTDNGTTINGPLTADNKPRIELRGNGITGQGVLVRSSNNVVRGLIINGFNASAAVESGGAGVTVSGLTGGGKNNTIERCYIGTDYTGNSIGYTRIDNNNTAGISLFAGASNNIVTDNVIAGNRGQGIWLRRTSDQSTSIQDNNTIKNNIVGLGADGTTLLANSESGIRVEDNSNNTVIGPGNTISGSGNVNATNLPSNNSFFGIYIKGQIYLSQQTPSGFIKGNVVKGNRIGTNVAGTAARANISGGVLVSSSEGTVVGGTTSTDGNLVSGNNLYNIIVQGDTFISGINTVSTTIANNVVGLTASNVALATTRYGIVLRSDAVGVTVGPNNTISGNLVAGVQLVGQTSTFDTDRTRDNVIKGNRIGLAPTGTTAVGNVTGVLFSSNTTNNIVEQNIISGNRNFGIAFGDSTGSIAPSANIVRNNQITNNVLTGVLIQKASTNNIVGPGNTISGQREPLTLDSEGVLLQDSGTTGNVIKGNTITNNDLGVSITGGASGNFVGGAVAVDATDDGNTFSNNTYGVQLNGAGVDNNVVAENRITNSSRDGVFVRNGAKGNQIRRTTTSANTGKGINLNAGSNVGNIGIAAPVPSNLAATTGGSQTLSGTINVGSTNCSGAGCTVEVFDSTTADNNEGPFFLVAFSQTASGPFSVTLPRACQPNLTFTLTDASGNTSEFTNAFAVASCSGSAPVQGAVPSLTQATPNPVTASAGATVTFNHTLSNVGTTSGVFTLSVSGLPSGWSATITPSAPVTLAPNGTQAVQLTVVVSANAAPGSYTATLSASTPGATAVSVTDTITIATVSSFTFTALGPDAQNAGPGQQVCYTHELTNTGNGSDTFEITVTPPAGWSFTVQPAITITLPQGGKQTVTVCYTVPQGTTAGSYFAKVNARAVNATGFSRSLTDTTTVVDGAVPQIGPAAPQSVNPGGSVTFTHTITNVGNLAGTFNLALAVPNGWTVTTPPATSTPSLAPQATFTTSYTVQVPTGTLAKSYELLFSAAATDANAATARVTDQVTVNQVAALDISAPTNTPQVAPSSVLTYTFTLTNSGNFTDTVAITASASRAGWSTRVPTPSLSVAPGATVPVTVSLIVPPGQVAGTANTTTVTATSSLPSVFDSASVATTVAAVPGAAFVPTLQSQRATAGTPLTYTFALLNSGSVPHQTSAITVTNVPAGWTSALTPTTGSVLQPGENISVTLRLQPPATAPNGSFDVRLSATATTAQGTATAEATARVRIGPLLGLEFAPDRASTELPGAVVRYTHTITNTGADEETFTFDTLTSLGWNASVSPANVRLLPSASATVTVTVLVPSTAGASEGNEQPNITFVTARSVTDPSVRAQVRDLTGVGRVAGASISPSRAVPLQVGRTYRFEHTLVNTGNGSDVFTITATQDLGWQVTIDPARTPVALGRAISYPVIVTVVVPANESPKAVNRIRIRAVSEQNPAIFDELNDVISATFTDSVPTNTNSVFLPTVRK